MNIEVGYLDTNGPHHYVRQAGFPLWTLGFCIRGSLRVTRSGVETVTRAGCVAVVRPNVPYTVASLDPPTRHTEYYLVLSMPPPWERWFAGWPETMPGGQHVHVPEAGARREIIRLFESARRGVRSRRPMAQELARNAIERVLILANSFAPAALERVVDPRVERAINFALAHLDKPLNIDALADAAGVSDSRFAHLFTEHYGQPPMRYVEGLRMSRAQSLLLTTSQPIRQVAASVGFTSQFHFADRFRARVGQSPSEYRLRPAGAGEREDDRVHPPLMDVRRD
jgi:AraC family transcriptional regulator of arabinose operon